ncbi:uncharacterized protein LOC134263519 [Saccostrea cucullata]|uniref:uncharacterized protein LOC134263519 n=1 Tax=Saccostrea cuccullata TaxID=36930 RepID=UPI002ED48E39
MVDIKKDNKKTVDLVLIIGCVILSLQQAVGHDKDRRLLLNDPHTFQVQLEAMQREMQTLKSLVNTQQTQIQAMQIQLNTKAEQGPGAIYTIWGKKSCPSRNGTAMVYTGITGGKSHYEPGGGVNTLCLPHDPDNAPHDFPTSQESAAHLFGSEYQFTYRKIARDDDVPCALCRVQSAGSILMIPAKTTCPSGWIMEYNGYLITDNFSNGYHATDFVCLHGDPEYLTEGARQHNLDGHILFPVTAVCGSLPCPPYKQGQHITCVVCSL